LPEKKESKGEQFIEYVRWFFWQMLLTLTAHESFFSSKRVERLLIFLNANILLDICVHHLVSVGKLDWEGSVGIYTAQMIYAGFQTKQIFNDLKMKKDENSNTSSTNTTTVTTENSSTSTQA
jgi:hypothetical protein